MAKQVTLGCKAKDIVSGFTGTVTSRHEGLDGVIQWGLQPLIDSKKPGELPDAISFDAAVVRRIGDGHAALARSDHPKLPFKLGDEVEDTTSGTRGIAVFRSDWMNGCTSISIQVKGKEAEAPPKRFHGPSQIVRRVGDGLNVPAKGETKQPERPRTGGPSMRVSDI